MKIAIEHSDPWVILKLSGDLDAEAGPGVYLRFQKELHQGQTNFLINLDGVELVDSAGLGVLVRCYRDARARGGTVCLLRVPNPIEKILEFTRLNTIFPITDDVPVSSPRNDARAA